MPGRSFLILSLVALAGCRTAPARVACYSDGERVPKREVVFGKQIAEDSLETVAHRPWESAGTFAIGTARFFRSIGQQFAGKTIRLRLAGEPAPISPGRPTLDAGQLEMELRHLTGGDLRAAQVELHTEHADALAALERVIDRAACRLDLIMFQWDNDATGRAIAERFAAKAATGVPVRVLIDGGGNLLYGKPKESPPDHLNGVVCWLARQPNVEVIRARIPLGRLDHRKLVLADSRIAWAGGRNFNDDEFTVRHDLSYTVRGPLVAEICAEFDSSWKDQGGKASRGSFEVEGVEANASARLVTTGLGPPTFQRALYRSIDSARHHVWLQNPYLSDGPLIAKLAEARQRGVDVRVLLTIQTGQVPFDRGNRATANRLLKAGVRVYIYPGLTHVKAAVVDSLWAYIGTGNFDPHSLRVNRESGLAVGGGRLIAEIEDRVFKKDLRPEWELKEPFDLELRDYLYELLVNLLF